jgi:hypothetical protein
MHLHRRASALALRILAHDVDEIAREVDCRVRSAVEAARGPSPGADVAGGAGLLQQRARAAEPSGRAQSFAAPAMGMLTRLRIPVHAFDGACTGRRRCAGSALAASRRLGTE